MVVGLLSHWGRHPLEHLTQPAIFDGHNDVLLKLFRAGRPSASESFLAGGEGAIDLPAAQTGGFGGGVFAAFVPSPMDLDDKFEEMSKDS